MRDDLVEHRMGRRSRGEYKPLGDPERPRMYYMPPGDIDMSREPVWVQTLAVAGHTADKRKERERRERAEARRVARAEAEVLGRVRYARNRAVLHTDRSLMPHRTLTWSSWNVMQAADTLDDQSVCLTYWMNCLQALDTEEEYFVTLNPIHEPDPARVLYATEYDHPQYTPEMMRAHADLPTIQGANGIWWCGAWTGYGFHEDGFTSGLNVARALGCEPPWTAKPA